MSEPAVWILATCDTKGHEGDFLRSQLRAAGVASLLVDCGSLGEPSVRPDVSREEVFRAAGTTSTELRARGDRGEAVNAAARGAAELVRRAHAEGRLSGVLGLGGSAGTTIGTAAMRALPLGVPKLMVSTLASGAVGHYVGTADIAMLHSVVDLAGLNRISRLILTRAAQAMAGMASAVAATPQSGRSATLQRGPGPAGLQPGSSRITTSTSVQGLLNQRPVSLGEPKSNRRRSPGVSVTGADFQMECHSPMKILRPSPPAKPSIR